VTAETRQDRNLAERALAFAVRTVHLFEYLNERGGAARPIGMQLLRAGTSIGANLEEARGAQSRADFISKQNIALKEAREALYWLRLLAASQIIPTHRLDDLASEADELVAVLTASVKRARSSAGPPRTRRAPPSPQ
jgi:four helix bundle protein